jgi:hypothetical protein
MRRLFVGKQQAFQLCEQILVAGTFRLDPGGTLARRKLDGLIEQLGQALMGHVACLVGAASCRWPLRAANYAAECSAA